MLYIFTSKYLGYILYFCIFNNLLYATQPQLSLSPYPQITNKYGNLLQDETSITSLEYLKGYEDRSAFNDYSDYLNTLQNNILKKSETKKFDEIKMFFKTIVATISLKQTQEKHNLQKVLKNQLNTIRRPIKEELATSIANLHRYINTQHLSITRTTDYINQLAQRNSTIKPIAHFFLKEHVTLPPLSNDTDASNNKLKDGQCPICLNTIAQQPEKNTPYPVEITANIISPCNHIFCSTCPTEWNNACKSQIDERDTETPEIFIPTCALCRQEQKLLFTFTLHYPQDILPPAGVNHTAIQAYDTACKSTQTEEEREEESFV